MPFRGPRERSCQRSCGRQTGILAGLFPAIVLMATSTLVAAQEGPASAPPASWPANRDGLVFLWRDGSGPNEVADPATGRPRDCRAEPRGFARFGRFFTMITRGGAFVAEGAGDAILASCRKTGQLTIEAFILPAPPGASAQQDRPTVDSAASRTGSIVSLSSDAAPPNFRLASEAGRLVFYLRRGDLCASGVPERFDLAPLPPGVWQHVVVTYKAGRVECYINGVAAGGASGVGRAETVADKDAAAGFTSWTPQHLVFGDDWTGGAAWAGEIQTVAIFSRALDQHEVQADYRLSEQHLKSRPPAERTTIRARLLQATATPDLRMLDVYRRALVVHRYEVREVLSGRCDARQILVAHWAVLDMKVVPRRWQSGALYDLLLERFQDHPELEPERQFRDFSEFDLPLYYEVDSP